MAPSAELDAIVLADDPLARVKIAGLAVRDRAARIAARAGARVLVVADAAARETITAWRAGRTCPVLVIRADQLVHTPLVTPLLGARGLAIAIDPDGGYAGALVAEGVAAGRVVEALATGESDTAIAATAEARVGHGELARHPIATAADRRAAHRMLYRILIKPQDNAITRYLFRPVSSRLTRLLVHTPVTPMHVSLAVAVLVAIGCWLTTWPTQGGLVAGALTILAATYLDCCDGEIARVKLQSSRVGAWVDTIVDELSSIGYMLALGWHCHLVYGRTYFGELGFEPWLTATVVGLVTYLVTLYCIYYNIIVGVGSANSQDYASRFHVVPGAAPSAVRIVPVPPKAARELPRWIAPIATVLPNVVRRDFIVWMAVVLAAFDLPHVSFAIHIAGGVVTSVIVIADHVHLRRLRRAVARAGQRLEPVAK